jgi:hypothetical protein
MGNYFKAEAKQKLTPIDEELIDPARSIEHLNLSQIHKRELRPYKSKISLNNRIVTDPFSNSSKSSLFDQAGVPATLRSSLPSSIAQPTVANPTTSEAPPPSFTQTASTTATTTSQSAGQPHQVSLMALPAAADATNKCRKGGRESRNTTQQMSKKDTGMSLMLRSGVSCGS